MVQRVRSAVAVDFGTTTSLVARRTGRGPATVLALAPLSSWLPSVAAYDDGRYIVGDQAEQMDQDKLIRSVKRAITERHSTVPLGGTLGNLEVPADDVIKAVLLEVRKRALEAGRSLARVREIRLGCPAMWDGTQRRRLLDVAVAAGLSVTGATLIDEPVAAGVAWLAQQYLHSPESVQGRLLVFDMGGGTVDVAVLDVVGGEHPEVSVLASRGVPLAGDKLDDAIVADLVSDLRDNHCDVEQLARPDQALGLLRVTATRTKILLSTRKVSTLPLPRQIFGRIPEIQYTRDRLESAFRPLMTVAENEIWAALLEARLRERFRDSSPDSAGVSTDKLYADIDYVLLAGGMSLMPYIQRRLRELFPAAAIVAAEDLDPIEAIVNGLTDTVGYDRINLHRPGFDFILEWDGGAQRRTLYEAHTPLYEPWQVSVGRTRLSYEKWGRELHLPERGIGHLMVISAAGKPVGVSVDGKIHDRLPVKFGFQELVFKLYCDGQLILNDGVGRQHSLRIDRWPIIRGRDDAALELKTVAQPLPDPKHAWYLDKEDYLPPSLRSGY